MNARVETIPLNLVLLRRAKSVKPILRFFPLVAHIRFFCEFLSPEIIFSGDLSSGTPIAEYLTQFVIEGQTDRGRVYTRRTDLQLMHLKRPYV